MAATVRAARLTFPTASIHVPLINYASNLPQREKLILEDLNLAISQKNHIPKLNDRDFKTGSDGIHWTPETAQAMLENWMISLN